MATWKMKGDITLEQIAKAAQRWHKGEKFTELALGELRHYNHCTTRMGYSAELIAGSLSTLARVNNFEVFK